MDPKPPRMSRTWRKRLTWSTLCISIPVVIALIISALFAHKMGILHIYRHLESPPFILGTALVIDGDVLTYISQCVNDTGVDPIEVKLLNKQNYAISYLCSQTKNKCEKHGCNGNNQCEKILTIGECSENTECFNAYGPDYICDIDICGCVKKRQCLIDSDCEDLNQPCSFFSCNSSGICAQTLKPGATCFSSDQCFELMDDSDWRCNQTSCACEYFSPFSSNTNCIDEFNCPDNSNPCSFYDCVNGSCDETLIPSAECAYTDECIILNNNSFSVCSWSTCVCEFSPTTEINQTCIVDGDCQDPLNNCTTFACVSGFCEEELAMGSSCYSNSDCALQNNGTDYYCESSNCSCIPRSTEVPSVFFLAGRDYLEGWQDPVPFSITQEQVGEDFFTHDASNWTIVYLDDPNGMYLISFGVQIDIEGFTWLNSPALGNTLAIIPGCYAIYPETDLTSITGNCLVDGSLYATAGITVFTASDTSVLIPPTAWLTIQKVS